MTVWLVMQDTAAQIPCAAMSVWSTPEAAESEVERLEASGSDTFFVASVEMNTPRDEWIG